MRWSSLFFTSERVLTGIAALLAFGLIAGCTSATGVPPSASGSAHAVYDADGHYGGWGTGFGNDGSRGRG